MRPECMELNIYGLITVLFRQMIDNNDGHNNIEESVIAKSTGNQEEEDIAVKDAALYNVLN